MSRKKLAEESGGTVLTAAQAKEITGGRTPLLPIEYETAIKALDACLTLDEARYWDNQADALAAWAKIYRSKDAERKSRQLKLYAFRRMGQIAGEIRPRLPKRGSDTGGSYPGPVSLLVDSGLSLTNANDARALAKTPKAKFDAIVNAARPPSPTCARDRYKRTTSEQWKVIAGVHGGNSLRGFAWFCRKNGATDLACGLTNDEAKDTRILLSEITDWLDEFERRLPKTSTGNGL